MMLTEFVILLKKFDIMTKSTFLLSFIILTITTFSQTSSENIRSSRRNAISIKVGGANYLSIAMDGFVTPKLNLEIDALVSNDLTTLGTGVKFYPWGDKNTHWSPYNGIETSYLTLKFIFEISEFSNTYIPIGISYIGKKVYIREWT